MKLIPTAGAACLLLSSLCAPASAVPIMDMKAEDLVPMVAELGKTLELNANQQTLWQQVEGRSRTLLRERRARRERLQQETRTALGAPAVELRELQAALDAEQAASAAEERELRAWWLTVNDALDDRQRQMVAKFLAEQLARVEDGPGRGGERGPGGEGGHHRGRGGMPGGR